MSEQSDQADRSGDIPLAVSSALQQLRIINESLAVSRTQRVEWQAHQAQARAKLQTRKRDPESCAHEQSGGEPKRPRSAAPPAAAVSLRTQYQGQGAEQPALIAAHPGSGGGGAALAAEVQQLREQLDAAAAQQRTLQERVRHLAAQNEELTIAKNAMLNDLMVDDDVQSLRDECARLRGAIEKRDGSIADYRARISLLEDSLAQVKEERNLMQQQRDDQQERASLGGGQAAPRSGSSGFSFRHVLDEGASRLKSAVYDAENLHTAAATPTAARHIALTRAKEASYQKRIMDLESQCAEALAQLRKQRLTHDHIESLGTQLVDLHGELDTLQRALVDAHADPASALMAAPPLALAAHPASPDERRSSSQAGGAGGASHSAYVRQ